MDLKEILEFSKDKLKPTSTKITYANGKQFLVNNGETKEIIQQDDEQQSSSIIYWSNKCGYLVDLVADYNIDEIIPRLFLSGDDSATHKTTLESKKITHILNLTSNVPNMFEDEIIYKKILMYDLPSQDISAYFKESYEFISEALKNENNFVLVHCNAGISRSASFVIAYLMQARMFNSYMEAFLYVKTKRSQICPNYGFRNQLMLLETQLKQN